MEAMRDNRGAESMRLTTRIKAATDGRLSLSVEEIPTLDVHARNVGEIPETVQRAAAELIGRKEEDLDEPLVVEVSTDTGCSGRSFRHSLRVVRARPELSPAAVVLPVRL
jgi:hypothetical protein